MRVLAEWMAGWRTAASVLLGIGFLACGGRSNQSGEGSGQASSSLFVKEVIYPQPVGVGVSCTYDANPSQMSESAGILDLAFRGDYSAVLLVGNSDAATGDGVVAGMAAQNVDLQGLSVSIEDAMGAPLGSFTSLTSGDVYAALNGKPGYTVIEATILDSGTTGKLKSTVSPGHDAHVVASFAVFGRTLGGTNVQSAYVQSDTFSFPIRVCEGCLVSFAPADMEPSLPEPNCANGQQASSTLPVPCVMGQDTPIDCSQCQQFPVCR